MRSNFLRSSALSASLVMSLAASSVEAAPAATPWLNPGLSPEARADLVVKAATPAELRGMIFGSMLFFMSAKERPAGIVAGAGYAPGIARLGIPPVIESDASLGVANMGGALRAGDVATAMPSSLGVAASFDPDLAREGGAMIGSEAKSKGFNVQLAGGVNLTRDPRGGRNFEYAGEDPLLAGRMTGAQIAGIQSNHIISTIKHFALNDQETGRTAYSVEMPEADMRESDLLAFRIAIDDGHPGSVMCAYNLVGGTYACENHHLLTDVLRTDWHWPGWVMSDWGAVHSTKALIAGLDQQSAGRLDKKPWFGAELDAKIASGEISQTAVSNAARHILRSMFAAGVVGVDWTQRSTIDYVSHAQIAKKAAQSSIVLLKNDANTLPIAATAKHIVVIGGHADAGVLAGGGSSQVAPFGGPGLTISDPTAKGIMAFVTKTIYDPSSPLKALQSLLPQAQVSFVDGHDIAAAVSAAKQADLAIVFATKESSEGKDSKDLALDGQQDPLIDAVAGASKTIVVLETGNPVLMPWKEKVGAIVEAWYPGQLGGEAIADVLVGKTNPSGRLPITFPASIDQLSNLKIAGADAPVSPEQAQSNGLAPVESPVFQLHFPEGADVGYRWYDAKQFKPLYAFGHGLSYTRFKIGNMAVTGGRRLVASFTVRNVGEREGVDVPQLYVREDGRAKRLVGWARISLKPGEARKVTIVAEPRIMAHWDDGKHAYAIKPGKYLAEIGESAIDTMASASASLSSVTLAP